MKFYLIGNSTHIPKQNNNKKNTTNMKTELKFQKSFFFLVLN